MRIPFPGQARLAALTLPNRWDLIAAPLVFGGLFLLAWGSQQMTGHYLPGETIPISLEPAALPGYALRTTLRMFAAMALSLVFTFTYATLAAKNRRAEQILVPVLDVLQSVPILGFLSITVVGFIRLFPGSLLGPEAAAIFAIFTSQAWNMAFSFYHSLRMIPKELYQVAEVFRLSAWHRFWRLEVPFAVPGLVWNAMMSMSGGWFFVVASEAISVGGQDITLPGVGSYIALAIQHRNLAAIGYAIGTMVIVIALYDQLVFRPLVAWSDKFRFEFSQSAEAPDSWLLDLLRRTRLLRGALAFLPRRLWERSLQAFRRPVKLPLPLPRRVPRPLRRPLNLLDRAWGVILGVAAVASVVLLFRFVRTEAGYAEIGQVFLLGLATAVRVAVLLVLATLVWVPVGVCIGLRPRLAQNIQPVVLFLSAFPANLLFPLAVSAIVAWRLNPEIWVSPLMILGTQWYILFNIIAGASAIPNDLREAAANLGLRRAILWRRMILPAVFPTYVTGGLTASGGAWNASVVSEVVSWGSTTLTATGIGAYIAQQTSAGDHPRIALGVTVMSLYVILFNRVLWRRLYQYAERRLILEG